jgi:neurofibromin 1
VWAVIGTSHDALIELVLSELLIAAVDAGMVSEKAECIGDILVSLASTAIRGKMVAKLRKVDIFETVQ